MKFIDKYHQAFYEENVKKTNSERDPYRKALFYTLGLTDDTRRHVNDVYDFRERGIEFEGLHKPWQTSTSMKVTRLAFNLYNGFNGMLGEEEFDAPKMYTPDNLFCNELMSYFFEAAKVRYPEYYHEIQVDMNGEKSNRVGLYARSAIDKEFQSEALPEVQEEDYCEDEDEFSQ